jgi:hypothetical protein
MPGGARRRMREQRFAHVMEYARWGLPVCPAAYPVGRRCSCQRLTCPAPAAHPLAAGWQREASTDPDQIASWLMRDARLNFVSPTGRVLDVLEVPAPTGALALSWMEAGRQPAGPVAAIADERYLFLTATRGVPVDEDEWWPCDLDYRPGHLDEQRGLRWHSRGSYVLVPPSVRARGRRVRWVRGPDRPLPDPLRVLDVLVDAQQVEQADVRPRLRALRAAPERTPVLR